MIIPTIDILNGKAVKLVQGSVNSKKYEVDALALAEKYSIFPIVNVIDLDAAFGKGNNTRLIKKICRICSCNVGGGIRTVGKVYDYLKAGANKIIIGTKADVTFLSRLPKEKIIVALDSRNGKVVTNGWTKSSQTSAFERVKILENYCSRFLYTFVDNEGMMKGIDYKSVFELKNITNSKISYAGGISCMADIKKLEEIGVDSVIGMAVYKKKINLVEAVTSILDFKKGNGLIPTIVQDEERRVLMLAYSSKESLMKTLTERRCCYFSRSRKSIWKKGETTGNTQTLTRFFIDCDNDTLLFIVKQKGNACHTRRYSCFFEKDFLVEDLSNIISDRKKNPRKNSYTNLLLRDEKLLKEKIIEETYEVINYRNKKNLIWEIADLMYFVNVLMARKGISPNHINRELESKHIKKCR